MNSKVSEVIQSIDTIKSESEYVVSQLRSKADLIDLEARNSFHHRITLSLLKCITCFNYHGTRNRNINKGIIVSNCP